MEMALLKIKFPLSDAHHEHHTTSGYLQHKPTEGRAIIRRWARVALFCLIGGQVRIEKINAKRVRKLLFYHKVQVSRETKQTKELIPEKKEIAPTPLPNPRKTEKSKVEAHDI